LDILPNVNEALDHLARNAKAEIALDARLFDAHHIEPQRLKGTSAPTLTPSGRLARGDLGELDYSDLIERVPLMAQVNALDHNYLAVLRGVTGNRVLVADLAGGSGTMTIDKFQACGLTTGVSMGHAGLVVERANGRKLPKRLQPKPSEFATLR
jgi:hypothetical protein